MPNASTDVLPVRHPIRWTVQPAELQERLQVPVALAEWVPWVDHIGIEGEMRNCNDSTLARPVGQETGTQRAEPLPNQPREESIWFFDSPFAARTARAG